MTFFVTSWSDSEEDEIETLEKKVLSPRPKKIRSEKKTKLRDHSFVLPAMICVSGASRAGKTVLCKAFIEQNRSFFDRIIVISGTARFNKEYEDLVKNPQTDIFEPSKIKKLERIVKLQEAITAKKRRYSVCLVLDNFLGSSLRLQHSEIFDKIASMARHIQITTVILTQRINKLSTVIRDNCHYWLVSRINRNDLDCLFPYQREQTSKDRFWKDYQEMTSERYSSMLIQNMDTYEKNIHYIQPV